MFKELIPIFIILSADFSNKARTCKKSMKVKLIPYYSKYM